MLDLSFIRENREKVREALKIRAPKLDFDAFLSLDSERRTALQEVEGLRSERNKANEKISSLLKEKKDPKPESEAVKSISQKIKALESQSEALDLKVKEALLVIPNLPHASVKAGTDGSQNTEVSR